MAVTLALTGQAGGAAAVESAALIGGLWFDHEDAGRQKLGIRIEPCDDRLCGRIVWMKRPATKEGEPKRDRRNPDLALRDRELCGLTILSGLQRVKDGRWHGQLYNPGDGRTYSAVLAIRSDGVLSINGYIGIPLLGRTIEWVRPLAARTDCLGERAAQVTH